MDRLYKIITGLFLCSAESVTLDYIRGQRAVKVLSIPQILGENLYGWPCSCSDKEYDYPMITCSNEACKDLSFIETSSIVARFNCPEITRRGFRIPVAVLNIVKE